MWVSRMAIELFSRYIPYFPITPRRPMPPRILMQRVPAPFVSATISGW